MTSAREDRVGLRLLWLIVADRSAWWRQGTLDTGLESGCRRCAHGQRLSSSSPWPTAARPGPARAGAGWGAQTWSAVTSADGAEQGERSRVLGDRDELAQSRTEAAFARLAGAAPVPATSGQTQDRHRLNRRGDRRLNHALHIVATTRLRQDPATRAYMARRLAEGKTKRESRSLSQALHRPARLAPPRAHPTARTARLTDIEASQHLSRGRA